MTPFTLFQVALAFLSIAKLVLELVERSKAKEAALATILLRMMDDAKRTMAKVHVDSDAARGRAERGELRDDDYRLD